jgi:hypothetical protein
MFRKIILALAATAAIGTAAITPTTASAHGWHGGHGHHGHGHFWGGPRFGVGFYPAYYGGYGGGCYYVKKLVPTPYGVIPKRVLVCS